MLFIQALWQLVPIVTTRKPTKQTTFNCQTTKDLPLAQIYGRRDIFAAQPTAERAKKRSLVGVVPQLTLPQNPKPPERTKPEFIDPLNISLNGIILATEESNSICIIADETGKEKTYRVGDNILDGTIIKVARQSIIVLRANGQQETYFLHGSEPGFGMNTKKNPIFNKIENEIYTVDPLQLQQEITSLGQFVEDIGLIPVYNKGKCVGMKIGYAGSDSLATKMGLQKDDLITSVDTIDITNPENRIKAFETVTGKTYSDSVMVIFKRNGAETTMEYKLERPKSVISPFISGSDEEPGETQSPGKQQRPTLRKKQFSESKLRERLSKSKEFKKRNSRQYDDNISAIRKRLLENMQNRSARARVR